jgi:hypothetical protein
VKHAPPLQNPSDTAQNFGLYFLTDQLEGGETGNQKAKAKQKLLVEIILDLLFSSVNDMYGFLFT